MYFALLSDLFGFQASLVFTSKKFESEFLEVLWRTFGTRRVEANNVYSHFIRDKEHTHMNATKWNTLSSFVKYLGREGKCKVEESEKGYLIEFIDRSPGKAIREQEKEKQIRKERLQEINHQKEMKKKAERNVKALAGRECVPKLTELNRDSESHSVVRIHLCTASHATKRARTDAAELSSAKRSSVDSMFTPDEEEEKGCQEIPILNGSGE